MKMLNCHNKELSLLLVDNQEIQRINKQYLKRDYPTNVIAFSQMEGKSIHLNEDLMGDVVISVEKALSDSIADGLAFEDELHYLIIHGILHLLGYNHEDTTVEDSTVMNNKADELFSSLNGYSID